MSGGWRAPWPDPTGELMDDLRLLARLRAVLRDVPAEEVDVLAAVRDRNRVLDAADTELLRVAEELARRLEIARLTGCDERTVEHP